MSARSRLQGLGRSTVRRVKNESALTAIKAKRGARNVERDEANPWLERSARLGYIVRGVLYAWASFVRLRPVDPDAAELIYA